MRTTLGKLRQGESGVIVEVERGAPLAQRLLEMGLLVGARVELAHEAPFGGDPVAVRVRGALVALRRSEAELVAVETSGEKP